MTFGFHHQPADRSQARFAAHPVIRRLRGGRAVAGGAAAVLGIGGCIAGGLGGLGGPAEAAVTHAAGTHSVGARVGWFHDPMSPAQRRAEIAVPAHPADSSGSPQPTRAMFRSHDGLLAVPVSWAVGHTLVSPQALVLTRASLFLHDSATLAPAAKAEIGALARSFTRVRSIRCEGYTDFGFGVSGEQRLSVQRARAVCELVRRAHPRITTRSVGYGGSVPVVVGSRSAQRGENRRVVLVVTGSVPAATAPSAPTMTGARAGDARATFTFRAPTRDGGRRVTGYQLSLDRGRTWRAVTVHGRSPYTVTVTGLTNGAHYPAKVRALNSVGHSAAGPAWIVTPTATPVVSTVASAPSLSTATAGNGSAAITFAAPASDGGSAVTGYQVSTDGGTTWVSPTTTGSGPFGATVTGLTNGTAYPVTVRAVNGLGDSPASNSLTVIPVDASIRTPGSPVITASSESYAYPFARVLLSFTAPLPDGGPPVTGYQIRFDDSGAFQPLADFTPGTPNTDSEIVDYSFCSIDTHTVVIQAVNANGAGPSSNTWTFVLDSETRATAPTDRRPTVPRAAC